MIRVAFCIGGYPPEEFKRLDDPRVQQFIHGRAEGPLSEETPARGPRDSRDEVTDEAAREVERS